MQVVEEYNFLWEYKMMAFSAGLPDAKGKEVKQAISEVLTVFRMPGMGTSDRM